MAIHHVGLYCGLRLFGTAKLLRITAVDSIPVFLARLSRWNATQVFPTGNVNPTPGEISLAHHGVLFLDELPEFKRSVLETMRQPLEEGRVTISRAAGTMTFPSQFMLVAAMNPTPDGKMPGESRCSPREIQNYLNRISARATNYMWELFTADLTVHPVGQKLPNPWGLYDMHGNVWEWCQDWYDSLPGGVQIDPTGPPAAVQFDEKVMRGGAYDYPNSSCRSASRLFFPATNTDTDLGFRVVFVIGP